MLRGAGHNRPHTGCASVYYEMCRTSRSLEPEGAPVGDSRGLGATANDSEVPSGGGWKRSPVDWGDGRTTVNTQTTTADLT